MEEKKHIYVHETHTLWQDNGELYIECEQGTIVWNLETLYNDLPHIYTVFKNMKKSKKELKKKYPIY